MQSRRFVITINNFTPDDEEKLNALPSKYLVYGRETGNGGTPHLQAFVIFPTTKTRAAVSKLLPRAFIEAAKGTSKQASDYCKKDGDFLERGELSVQGKRTDLQTATDLISSGSSLQEVAQECPEVFVKFGRGLRDLKLTLDVPYTPPDLRGLWYVGAPGTGKSRTAREEFPDAYLKCQNKWWDGYAGQKAVILDDMDSNALGHHLKIWTDRYPCTGETKGGTINLQHDKFIVTSNFTIDQLFGESPEICEAVKRRFTVKRFPTLAGKPLV